MPRWLLALSLLFAFPAQGAWLVGLPMDATRVDLASRDVPATQVDYDGRAHGALGGSFVVWQRDTPWIRGWEARWELFGMAAADNGTARGPSPSELARWQVGSRLQVWSPEYRRTRLRLDVAGVRQVATTLGSYTLPEGPPVGGIAFGGSGHALDLGVGAEQDRGGLRLAVRFGDRVHLPGWLALFGQHGWANVVGDALADDVLHQLQADAVVSITAFPQWQPLFALHGDTLVPLEGVAHARFASRYMLGVLHPIDRGALLPFLSLDIGAGAGMLVNRNEVRLGVGVRYVP